MFNSWLVYLKYLFFHVVHRNININLVLGLKTGYVIKIYLDNPFPAHVTKIEDAVRCLDISSLKEKMAVVSEAGILSVFDLCTGEKLQEYQDVNSVAFNIAFEDIMCFAGNNYLAIKVANFSEYRQKFSGFVVGHNGSKLHCLNGSSIITLEVSCYENIQNTKYKIHLFYFNIYRFHYHYSCINI